MTSDVNKVASVVGGKTARACDSCIRKRARWYCTADDAFLCQSCDSSVHSANPLARRHERVRLKYASFKSPADDGLMETRSNRVPSWNKRKARTPRGNKKQSSSSSITSPITSDEVVINSFYHVPEALSDETRSFDEQLVYGRVPIFDSFAGESCTCPHSADEGNEMSIGNQNASFGEIDMKGYFCNDLGFLTSDMDLEEFAADVLGIDGLGLMGCDMMVEGSMSGGRRSVKEEDEEVLIEMAAEQLFQYHDNAEEAAAEIILNDCDVKKRKILLRLDYDGILSAWPDGSSPWTSGTRPDVDHSNNECWPTCMATACQIDQSHQQRNLAGRIGDAGGREARVSRYREKRRTRLFSKKIRYEVRKLNAEKRPRMKGRFVKRSSSSFLASSSSTVSLHVHGEE